MGWLQQAVAWSLFIFLQGSSLDTRFWCLPQQKCWPDDQIWRAFNDSVQGRLIEPHPSAFPCHDPHYDSEECEIARTNWTNGFWRADQAGSTQAANWEALGDENCLIEGDPSIPCAQGAVPRYAVRVGSVEDVQESVGFAAEHGIRLVVRNTGHDYMGRSSGEGTLSVWMHGLKRIRYEELFIPEGCKGAGVAGLTAEAGVQWKDLYEAADANGVVVVGGQASSVGVAGGYVQGGGHGPLSRYFGLAADNVLQFTVVTPDSRIRIANECQNQDLFWALRGGGGGTFGIVISVTFRAFPSLHNIISASYFIQSNTSSHIQALVAHFNRMHPSLSDFGWSGYFTIKLQSFFLQYLVPNTNISSAQASLTPLLNYLNNHPGLDLSYQSLDSYPSFKSWHTSAECSFNSQSCTDPTGFSAFLASRLVSSSVIQQNPGALARIFMDGLRNGATSIFGHLVAGRMVSIPRHNAVNPAWRSALWHIVFGLSFSQNSTAAERQNFAAKITSINGPLRNLASNSGSYLNEADFQEPNWQESFFGAHYAQLLKIKQQIDPRRILSCHFCVGSVLP